MEPESLLHEQSEKIIRLTTAALDLVKAKLVATYSPKGSLVLGEFIPRTTLEQYQNQIFEGIAAATSADIIIDDVGFRFSRQDEFGERMLVANVTRGEVAGVLVLPYSLNMVQSMRKKLLPKKITTIVFPDMKQKHSVYWHDKQTGVVMIPTL